MTYQIIDWEKNFEGSKSKGYNNKTTCQMPTKHGLGYKHILRHSNGPALFGAWCALIQVLSRHEKPRQGYCTDTGRVADRPLTPQDMEMLTDIPATIFSQLLSLASQPQIGWLRIVDGYHEDTTGIPQGSLDSDSDSDSDYDSNSDSNSVATPSPCGAGECFDSKNDSSNSMDDDSSSQGNTNPQGNHDSQENTEYQEIAKELAEIVMSAKNIKVNTAKIKQWGNEIRKLHSVDGIEPSRMRSVLSWYSSNIGGEYVPIVESGKSFRSKFLRLENAVKRDSSNPSSPKPRPKPEFIDTSIKTFQEVYNANKVSRTDMFQEYCNIPLNTLLLELGEDDVVGVCPRICVDGQFMRFTAKRIVGLEKYSIRVDWVSCLDGLTKFSDFYPFAT